MGNDGGSIAKRNDLAKQKKRAKKILHMKEQKQARATLCAISEQPLYPPLVSCKKGMIFNKEIILHKLIEDKTFFKTNQQFRHIKRYKDLQTLNVQLSLS